MHPAARSARPTEAAGRLHVESTAARACLVVAAAVLLGVTLGPLPVAAERSEGGGRAHTVAPGDTLASIALDHGAALDDLLAANELPADAVLRVGQVLRLPRPGGPHHHVVRSGETAAEIAADAGCSVDELLALNRLDDPRGLRPGDALRLPPRAAGGDSAPDPEAGTHVVKVGESLNEIAHRYGVGTAVLARVNRIGEGKALRPGRVLRIPEPRAEQERPSGKRVRLSGWKVPAGVKHRVMDGQSWGAIARGYGVRLARLKAANPDAPRRLDVADVVMVPGASEPKALPVGNCGFPAVRFQRGSKAETIRLLQCSGRVSPAGRRRLSKLATAPAVPDGPLLDARLFPLVQRVADEWPGRPLRIVSGYRQPEGEATSRHHRGRAIDFSVVGVENRELYDFCRNLPGTGVGYYPNSTFVHLDVRRRAATWVDSSGAGETPRYAGTAAVEAESDARVVDRP